MEWSMRFPLQAIQPKPGIERQRDKRCRKVPVAQRQLRAVVQPARDHDPGRPEAPCDLLRSPCGVIGHREGEKTSEDEERGQPEDACGEGEPPKRPPETDRGAKGRWVPPDELL